MNRNNTKMSISKKLISAFLALMLLITLVPGVRLASFYAEEPGDTNPASDVNDGEAPANTPVANDDNPDAPAASDDNPDEPAANDDNPDEPAANDDNPDAPAADDDAPDDPDDPDTDNTEPKLFIELKCDSKTLAVGDHDYAYAFVYGDNLEYTVSWDNTNSSAIKLTADDEDPKVGRIIEAVAEGEAVIKATVTYKVNGEQKTISDSCTLKVKKEEDVLRISLEPEQKTLLIGQTCQLKATVTKNGTETADIKPQYSTDNVDSYYAEVDETTGKVTAKAKGSVTVTATVKDEAGDEYKAYSYITIAEEQVDKITLNKTKLELEAGKSETLTATISPSTVNNKELYWYSEDEETVASVDPTGKVTAINEGTTKIWVTSAANYSVQACCEVTVTVKNISVTLDKSSVSMKTGEENKKQLKATVIAPNGVTTKVTWSSDKEDIVKVDENGNLTGIANGKAVVTVTAEDATDPAKKAAATCDVTVSNDPVESVIVKVSSQCVDENGIAHIYAGNTVNISADVYLESGSKAEGASKEVVWDVDNKNKAIVDNGKLKAIAPTPDSCVVLTAKSAEDSSVDGVGLVCIDAYSITEGNGSKWVKGSGKDLPTITIKFSSEGNKPIEDVYALADVTSITVDNNKLKAEDYSLVQGSYKVTVKNKYLESLKSGDHKIAVTIVNGIGTYTVTGTFTTSGSSSSSGVKTEDVTRVGLALILFSASLAYVLWYKKAEELRKGSQPALAVVSADGSVSGAEASVTEEESSEAENSESSENESKESDSETVSESEEDSAE